MSDPTRNENTALRTGFSPRFKNVATLQSSFRLDEGYSEETRSQAGSEVRADSRMSEPNEEAITQAALPAWVFNMTESDRAEFVYLLLRSLRTSSVAAIVDRLYPRLHMDPIIHLPPAVAVRESILRSAFGSVSLLSPASTARAGTGTSR